jgi:hypothetical protein
VQIVEQPLSAVVLGAGKMLGDNALLKRLAVNWRVILDYDTPRH